MIQVVHCKREPDSEYIGRPSPLGNPFPLKNGEEKGSTLPKYKEHLFTELDKGNQEIIGELKRLKQIALQGELKLGCWCAPSPCHGDIIKELLEHEIIKPNYTKLKILECSSKGDKRFSAFYARVNVFGKYDSIENHYQLSKRFGDEDAPQNWRDSKGRVPTHFNLKGKDIDINLLSQFYKILWVKYLLCNPELVEYASQFDEYNDIFKGKSTNCQADVVRQYIKEGRESIMDECSEFLKIMKELQDN